MRNQTCLDILRAHGHDEARIRPDGMLEAEVAWTRRRADGTIEVGADVEIIAPRVSAVREWLGY